MPHFFLSLSLFPRLSLFFHTQVKPLYGEVLLAVSNRKGLQIQGSPLKRATQEMLSSVGRCHSPPLSLAQIC